MKNGTQGLDHWRQRVGELDREILSLIHERLETTKKIGEIKRQEGLPIRDFRVEVLVLKRARDQAKALGLDERVAEEIAERLMTAAVQTQAELPKSSPSEQSLSVHVVGGHGRMGHWLARFFEAQGHTVSISDPQEGLLDHFRIDLSQALQSSKIVVLATPLSHTPHILRECLDQVQPGTGPTIFDIASLKTDLVRPLREAAERGYRVSSLHPMFAPGAALLHGRAVLVCDAGCKEATEDARALFADTALGLYDVPLEEHDRLMAVVLGLSHMVNLIFGRAVARSGFPFELLGRLASTTFAKQIKTAAEVAEENPHLYHGIQHLNHCTPEMLEELADALEAFRDASEDGESQRFVQLMAETRSYLNRP